jgi:hypothetical protein
LLDVEGKKRSTLLHEHVIFASRASGWSEWFWMQAPIEATLQRKKTIFLLLACDGEEEKK